ncbi:Retrovirus-related Pol polyprotein from transposon TNT 1-94 [Dendrobium catenatum]|uniref:Retrovirus-related Pol polyprotein from transposon TNT 1-94 n=1 Tax=Dendrobium catenatum TaxID=906689 RepID=A0A2I0XG89_9ASPA|nr:Retrovirus-related Pol polyprotein from transposon TNT 1-94 [Dendrobium catenatum]
MKNLTMAQYLIEIKNIVDNIAAAGSKVDTEDIILYILNGLPSSYQAFKTLIRTNLQPISLDDLYSLLISEEINIQADSIKQVTITDQSTALYSARGRGRRGRGRSGHQTTKGRSSTTVITCQICNKRGHSAYNCWHRLNTEYNPQESHQNSQANSRAMVAANKQPNPNCYLDSGALVHLTNFLDSVSQEETYNGSDTITIGDSRSLPIAHSSNGILHTPYRKLQLSPLLHIQKLSHN